MARGKYGKKRAASANARPEQGAGGRHRLTISFSIVTCTGCGDRRASTQACATCGRAPGVAEFDVKGQRRRRAAESVRAHVAEKAASAAPPVLVASGYEELSALLSRLVGFPERLFASLDGLDAGGDAERQSTLALCQLYEELWREEALATQPWLRPWRRYGRGAAAVVRVLRRSMLAFLDAYASSDFGLVQRTLQQAQTDLDLAGALTAALGEDIAFADACLSLDEADLLSTCLARELERLDVQTSGLDALLALDREGRRRLSLPADADEPGIGLQAQLVLLPAAILLDPDQLVLVHEVARDILRTSRLGALSAEPEWRAYQQAATTTLLDALRTLADLAASQDLPPRRGVRAQLQFVQDLTEAPLRHLMATLLACSGSDIDPFKQYSVARGGSGAAPVAEARQELPTPLTQDVLVPVRHASAHMDYRMNGNLVTLQASKPARAVTVTHEQLADAVLGALETTLALQLAVLLASDELGLDLDDEALLDELDPHMLMQVMLAASGWRDVQVAREGSVLRVAGHCEIATPIGTIGMLLTRLDEGIDRLVLVAKRGDGTRTFAAACGPFRDYAEAKEQGELESMLAFTTALAQVTIDGKPAVTTPMLRRAAAVFACQELDADLPVAVARLLRLHSWATALGDDELADALLDVRRAVVAREGGWPASPAEQASIDRLAEWVRVPAPMPDVW
jgi:hypothetical protein